MVELEAGTPVRGTQQRLDGTGQVHKAIAHQEEHGEERGQVVDVAQEDAALANAQGEDECTGRFAALGGHGKRCKERNNTVLCNSLQ